MKQILCVEFFEEDSKRIDLSKKSNHPTGNFGAESYQRGLSGLICVNLGVLGPKETKQEPKPRTAYSFHIFCVHFEGPRCQRFNLKSILRLFESFKLTEPEKKS